jgi:hypothetical protein
VQHLTLQGLRLRASGLAAGRYGIKLRPSARDIEHVALRDVRIETEGDGEELRGAVWIVATNDRAIDKLELVDVAARGGRHGVVFDGSGGGRIQSTPVLQGVSCAGCERAWTSVNAAADRVFPIVARDQRTRAHRYSGTLPPEDVFSAPPGSEYEYEDKDGARRLRYRKVSGDDARGWRAAEEAVLRGPCDPAIEITQITTGGAETYSLADGTADGQVKRITIAAVAAGARGVLRPARFASGRALSWSTTGSVSLVWDHARGTWRILGKPDRVTVE